MDALETTSPQKILPREGLDFGLDDEDIPRFWFDQDPFKTRFFDALSAMFPEGEKFFISCVRDYRDQIDDPQLLQDVKAFTRQEAQHTLVHRQYNKRLKQQGIPVEKVEQEMSTMCGWVRRNISPKITIADTAACEHLTSVLAHGLIEREDFLERTDPRLRALYTWHAIEEIEHKAVAYDVMTKVAKTGYFTRILLLILELIQFSLYLLVILEVMLKIDGFSLFKRLKLWMGGLWWLYGPGGVFPPLLKDLFAYFKPGFHPDQHQPADNFQLWVNAFNDSGDPLEADKVLHSAHAC